MMGSKTTMLSIMMVVVLVLVVEMMEMVDTCERRGEELVCLGELPTLDEKEVDLPTSLHIQCQDSRPPKINSNSPLFHTIRLSLSDCSLDCTSLTGLCSSILNLVPILTSLSINNIDSLPASVCSFFPRLSNLNLTENHLNNLSPLDLARCNHLHDLAVTNNQIRLIEPDQLPKSLRSLTLAGSPLESVSLPPLPSLSLLDLSSSDLSYLSPSLLVTTPSLKKLMLQNNSLSSLPSSLLSPLDSLLLLNLSSNALTHSTLEPALRDQVKLIALDVSHNKLDKVGRGLLSSLAQLQILNLGHNKIANVKTAQASKS